MVRVGASPFEVYLDHIWPRNHRLLDNATESQTSDRPYTYIAGTGNSELFVGKEHVGEGGSPPLHINDATPDCLQHGGTIMNIGPGGTQRLGSTYRRWGLPGTQRRHPHRRNLTLFAERV